ncbi:MAG TPA: biotin/lipoyl-containing protein [Candidatus Thermoplasmatota archaeon]|nr:biotin/lipoyl-containing protein [Candidatus Thermoplasmatota archaeon]
MKVLLEIGGDEFDAFVKREADKLTITIEGEAFDAKIAADGKVTIGGKAFAIKVAEREVVVDGSPQPFRILDIKTGTAGDAGGGGRGARIKPPMPGKIVTVAVNEGDEVKTGQVLVILEAMKMQNEIVAPSAGTVKKVSVKPGQNVEGKDVLIELE